MREARALACRVVVREPEVQHDGSAVGRQHDVGRLDVPMHETNFVRGVQGAGDLLGDREPSRGIPRFLLVAGGRLVPSAPCPAQRIRHGLALEMLERDPQTIAVATDVDHPADLGVLDARHRLRLATKACGGPRRGRPSSA